MAIGTTQGQSVDPSGIDQGLEEFVKGRGGMPAFIPGGMEKGLASIGGGEMRDALTAAQDTYYSELKDRDLNNPFSLSESEQSFIDNFDNRGDDRTIKYDTPAVSDDGIGYDFSSPPPVTGIQPSIASSDLENVGASFDRPIGNPAVPAVPTDNAGEAENVDVSMYPQYEPSFSPTTFGPPMVTGQGAENLWNILGRRYRSNPELDKQVFTETPNQEPNSAGGGVMDFLSNLLGFDKPAEASGGPVALSMPLNQPPATPPGMSPGGMGGSLPPPPSAPPIQSIGDGFGEAGTEMDFPAPPPSSSGSVSMPTQGMTQENRPVPPGLMQTLLNRMSGKDPANPFTGNPPAPSSGSVKMPTSGPGY